MQPLQKIPGHPPMMEQTPEAAAWDRWFQLLQSSINSAMGVVADGGVAVPAEDFSYQIFYGRGLCLILPTTDLAVGTVILPVGMLDGYEQEIMTSRTVSSLTVRPGVGQTLTGTATFPLQFGVPVTFLYGLAANQWTRTS